MDCQKVGDLIYRLRKEKQLTQKELANQIGISDKTISKWERGLGCPDVSLLKDLSEIFQINIEKILDGKLTSNIRKGGNMKRIEFYVCPLCGNLLTSSNYVDISCCGRQLDPLTIVDHQIPFQMKNIDGESLLTFDCQMSKEDYISFVAYVEYDRYYFIKLYPEQAPEVRLPELRRGKLYCYSIKEGFMLLK